MKRASYREAVEYIALNDNAGSDSALDVIEVASMISVDLIAYIFRKDINIVAKDVIKVRIKENMSQVETLLKSGTFSPKDSK